MTLVVQLRTKLPNPEMAKLAGKFCTNTDGALLLQGDADVYRPDGEPLLFLRKGWVGPELSASAYPALHHLRTYTSDNRGVYAGVDRYDDRDAEGKKTKNSRTRDADGKLFQAASAIIGYFDRQGGRHPFCRATRFTADEVDRWATVLPLIDRSNELFRTALPQRYAAQKAACDATHPDWVIRNTVFSTVTVNNNTIAANHQDKGDFKDGFGVITCLRRGLYTGARLCFPQYRVGVELEDGDTILFDPHAWHGMTHMQKQSDDAERITCVFYFREKMRNCGTPEEERANAKKVRGSINAT
jgi:hypothetical protein